MSQPHKKPVVHLKNEKAKLHVGTRTVEIIVRVPINKLLRALRKRHHR